ncbi:Outer membrane protein TolC precursor [compost metagenome]
MKVIKIIAFSMIQALICPVLAQSFNLEEALRVSQESSPEVRKSKAAREEAEWKNIEAYSFLLPKLNASALHLADNRYMVSHVNLGGKDIVITQVSPMTNWSLRAEWMVFDWFANWDNFQAMRYGASAAVKQNDWALFQLEQNTKIQFYKTLAADELSKVARQNVMTLEDHLKRAQRIRDSGAGTDFDVLRVEVQLSEAQSEQLNAEDIAILAKKNFFRSLGLEFAEQNLSGDIPIPDSDRVKNLAKPELQTRADFQAITDLQWSAHKAHLAAFKHWLPKFSVFGQADYYNNISRGINEQDYNNSYAVGLLMTWNLFDGFGSMARSAQADERQIQASESVRQAHLKMDYDFDFWKRRYLYSSSLYKAKVADISKAAESVRLATKSFNAGTRTNSEVLDAELDLFKARAGLVNAKANAIEALLNLELAMGHKLD